MSVTDAADLGRCRRGSELLSQPGDRIDDRADARAGVTDAPADVPRPPVHKSPSLSVVENLLATVMPKSC